jgi:hypothetical protein
MNLNENKESPCVKRFLPVFTENSFEHFEWNSATFNSFACLDGKIMHKRERSHFTIGFIFIAMILLAFVFCGPGCNSLKMRLRLLITGERNVNMAIDPIALLRQDQISQLMPVMADAEEENAID